MNCISKPKLELHPSDMGKNNVGLFVVGKRGKDQRKRVFFPFTHTASYKGKKKKLKKVGKNVSLPDQAFPKIMESYKS